MKLFGFLLLFLFSAFAQAQIIHALTKVKLPERIIESSGLAIQNGDLLTHNDGGSGPVIYRINKKGFLIDSTYIKSTYNFDWEDISFDKRQLYIAETGNNLQSRKDLAIYTLNENAVLVKTTRFWYARQKTFPPAESNRDFDCEALLVRNDTAYIFSKTWSKPYKGISYQYEFPVTADSVFSLNPVDSFATGKNNYLEGSITGCDLSPGRKYFALTSCNYLYVFFDFEKNNFLQGNYAVFRYESTAQREAIAFETDSTFYVTDERWANMVGGNLYSFNLAPYLDGRISYTAPEITAVKSKKNGKQGFILDVETDISTDTLTVKFFNKNGDLISARNIIRKEGKFSQSMAPLPISDAYIRIYDKKRLVYCHQW